MQMTQEFQLDFLLDTSQVLGWRHEAQGNLDKLPPRCFTISRRGARSNRESGGLNYDANHCNSFDGRPRFCHAGMTLRKVFCQTGKSSRDLVETFVLLLEVGLKVIRANVR